jgi:hypothetical protein
MVIRKGGTPILAKREKNQESASFIPQEGGGPGGTGAFTAELLLSLAASGACPAILPPFLELFESF